MDTLRSAVDQVSVYDSEKPVSNANHRDPSTKQSRTVAELRNSRSFRHRLIGLDRTLALYERVRETMHSENRFSRAVLKTMNLTTDINRHETIRIPRSGSVLICSNHPHGALDGIALLDVILGVREDIKILANDRLMAIEELRPFLIPLSLDSSSPRSNYASMREAIQWLQSGGALLVFPAGEVSAFSLYSGRVADAQWSEHIGRLAEMTKVPVLPMFIHGSNSLLFQLAGIIHPSLRSVLLLREFLRMQNKTILVRVGALMPSRQYLHHPAHRSIADFLRSRCLLLRYKAREQRGSADMRMSAGAQLEEAVSSTMMTKEIAHLPLDQRLYDDDEFLVLRAQAAQIPSMLREIGRLRELSFRMVGEGTMKAVDLDSFDSLYEHIVLWNRQKQEVVGAYRVGRCDELLKRYGKRGVYLNTLFELSDKFLSRAAPALEMGRSFIRPEYQKNSNALHLLWKGIGAFIVQNPHYRYLIGPVSISNEYSKNSQRLLVASLSTHHMHRGLSRTVKARHPLDKCMYANWDALLHHGNIVPIDQLAPMIENVEWDSKSIPVLLRHYIRLGAKVVAFHRDHDFGSCMDALVVVDLWAVEARMLSRYLGVEGAAAYAQFNTIELSKTESRGDHGGVA